MKCKKLGKIYMQSDFVVSNNR